MSISRRTFMKTVGAGAAAAGVAGYIGTSRAASAAPTGQICYPGGAYTWFFDELQTCCPGEPLDADEMRITFLGTSCIPRLSQQGVSVYVEVGPSHKAGNFWVPADYAMFDCGMGVLSNYIAAGIPYSRMDKIFLAHLHADHMSELTAIFCFGEAYDRKSPQYVWGPSASGVPDPVTGQIYEDGTRATMEHFREWVRWHTESFSFGQNSYKTFVPPTQAEWHTPQPLVPVGPTYRENGKGKPVGGKYADPYGGVAPNAKYDSYALVPIELNWREPGLAYWNEKTGLKITHFPAIHCRTGSIAYKVEFTPPGLNVPPITMVYSSDTRPNTVMLQQALGVDVLAHEIVMPPDQWVAHIYGVPAEALPPDLIQNGTRVVNSSHTTQGAFGFMLKSLMDAGGLPRLTAATHFQAQDETIALARQSLDAYGIPHDRYTFAADFMVLNVKSDKGIPVVKRRMDVSKFAFAGQGQAGPYGDNLNMAKYHDADGEGDPDAQIDNSTWIPWTGYPGNPYTTYDENGY